MFNKVNEFVRSRQLINNVKTNFQVSYAMYLISLEFPDYNILFRSCSWKTMFNFSKWHLMYGANEPNITENSFIIFNINKYWVLLTNHENNLNTWRLYDSIGSACYFNDLVYFFKALSEVVSTDCFVVESRSVQKQKGASDCGLFALANLISICNRLDPSDLIFDQNKMREHYNNSIVKFLRENIFTVYFVRFSSKKNKITDT